MHRTHSITVGARSDGMILCIRGMVGRVLAKLLACMLTLGVCESVNRNVVALSVRDVSIHDVVNNTRDRTSSVRAPRVAAPINVLDGIDLTVPASVALPQMSEASCW